MGYNMENTKDQKKAGAELLLREFGKIDEQYIAEAAPAAKLQGNGQKIKKRVLPFSGQIIRFAGTAAAAVIVLYAAFGILQIVKPKGAASSSQSVTTSGGTAKEMYDTAADEFPAEEAAIAEEAPAAGYEYSEEATEEPVDEAVEESAEEWNAAEAPEAAAAVTQEASAPDQDAGYAATEAAPGDSLESGEVPVESAEEDIQTDGTDAIASQENSFAAKAATESLRSMDSFENLEEAQAAAGFFVSADLQGADVLTYGAVAGRLLNIQYDGSNAYGILDITVERITGQTSRYRDLAIAAASHAEYDTETAALDAADRKYILRKDSASGISELLWNDSDYAYAVIFTDPTVKPETLMDAIKAE